MVALRKCANCQREFPPHLVSRPVGPAEQLKELGLPEGDICPICWDEAAEARQPGVRIPGPIFQRNLAAAKDWIKNHGGKP